MDQVDVHEVWRKWSEKLSSWWRTRAKPKKKRGMGRIHTGLQIHMHKYDSDERNTSRVP